MGMVVRTNTMALNAYRQLGMNNSAVSKSLEKLSSGFRINRAGDDAAGLAISEKMKAQITGLETASANAQDGISLIQTAEGNLSEVHDMLNRMVELASKSANGTYTSTERQALQDEVDQLLSEIDRISQSANFNGTKLLDGSLDSTVKEVVKDPTILGEDKYAFYNNPMDGANKPQLHKDATGEAKTSFSISFNDLKITAKDDGTAKVMLELGRTPENAGTFPASYSTEYVTLSGKEAGENYTGTDIAKAVYDQIGANGNDKHTILVDLKTDLSFNGVDSVAANEDSSVQYEVKLEGDTLTFTMTDAGVASATKLLEAAAGTVDKPPFEGNFTACVSTTDPANRKTAVWTLGTTQINVGGPNTGEQLASTNVALDKIFTDDGHNGGTVKDGAGIKVGNEYYVFASTKETAEAKYGDNVKVVDIRDLVQNDGKTFKDIAEIGGTSGLNQAIARLTTVAKDNEMFYVEHAKEGGIGVLFGEKQTYSGDADLTTEDGLKEQLQYFTGIRSNVETTPATGKALTLQIGDTADDFNKMSVNVADMSTKGLNLNGLSIMTEADASNAIDTVKTAINSVSTARAGMGALQNRLEHTINNLDVAVENLSAANSRIRDTDMAKEMMNYTKMNVLVQSAQAMLAQANQQPQSVLQLLQ